MRRGLSRGLESLVAERAATVDARTPPEARGVEPGPDATLPISDLVPNPFQPRSDFDPEDLDTLADSIRRSGMSTIA